MLAGVVLAVAAGAGAREVFAVLGRRRDRRRGAFARRVVDAFGRQQRQLAEAEQDVAQRLERALARVVRRTRHRLYVGDQCGGVAIGKMGEILRRHYQQRRAVGAHAMTDRGGQAVGVVTARQGARRQVRRNDDADRTGVDRDLAAAVLAVAFDAGQHVELVAAAFDRRGIACDRQRRVGDRIHRGGRLAVAPMAVGEQRDDRHEKDEDQGEQEFEQLFHGTIPV